MHRKKLMTFINCLPKKFGTALKPQYAKGKKVDLTRRRATNPFQITKYNADCQCAIPDTIILSPCHVRYQPADSNDEDIAASVT